MAINPRDVERTTMTLNDIADPTIREMVEAALKELLTVDGIGGHRLVRWSHKTPRFGSNSRHLHCTVGRKSPDRCGSLDRSSIHSVNTALLQ